MQVQERKNLELLTVSELIKTYATPLQIPNRHKMKKAELIEAICAKMETETTDNGKLEFTKSEEKVVEVKEEVPITVPNKDDIKADCSSLVKHTILTEIQKQNKMRYVENAEIGTIVAFKLPGMKVKSAKIIRKSTKNRKYKVETAYGTDFVISFDDIIWVKTNKRWPKGVYNLLKGIGDE